MRDPIFQATRLIYGGQILPSKSWQLPLHHHANHELIVILEGIIHIRGADGSTYRGQAGQALIYPSGTAHEEVSDTQAPVKTYYFGFDGSAPQALSLYMGVEERIPTLARFLLSEFAAMYPDIDQEKSCAYLNLIARELTDISHADAKKQRIYEANLYMAEHYPEAIQLEDIAAACHCSKYHFSRLYKSITGESPMQALKKTRLQQASILLKSTGLPIAAIARQTGFSNEYHFSREFKKHIGLTPSTFRRG